MRTGARREEAASTNSTARWLIHRQTDRCGIRTHLTQLNSQREVFARQSSEELKPNMFTWFQLLKVDENWRKTFYHLKGERKKNQSMDTLSVGKLDQLHYCTFIRSPTGALRSSSSPSVWSLSSLDLCFRRGSAGSWAAVDPRDNHYHHHFYDFFLLPLLLCILCFTHLLSLRAVTSSCFSLWAAPQVTLLVCHSWNQRWCVSALCQGHRVPVKGLDPLLHSYEWVSTSKHLTGTVRPWSNHWVQ